jgi:hypothetical protein
MGIADIRQAFTAAARGHLHVKDVGMRYTNDGGQVLHFTGWHRDGTPFAFVSSSFFGDPDQRAAEIAEHLLIAHTGIRSMPAPAPIKALAQTLREHLAQATARADRVAVRASESVSNLHGVLDTADAVVKEVDAAAADIQAALGINTNSGPGGPLSE